MANQPKGADLATIAAMYTKRLLEKHYDKLAATDIITQLKNKGGGEKYILEFVLYVFAAMLNHQLDENTAIKKFLHEVAIDAPPEIAKRIINNSAASHSPKGVLPINSFLELGNDELMALLDWLNAMDTKNRTKTLKTLGALNNAELKKVIALDQEKREKFLDFFETSSHGEKSFSEKASDATGEALDDILGWLKAKL